MIDVSKLRAKVWVFMLVTPDGKLLKCPWSKETQLAMETNRGLN